MKKVQVVWTDESLNDLEIIYSLDDKVLYVEAVVDTRQDPDSYKL